MYRLHLHYDFISDNYSVDIVQDNGYDGYTGQTTDTVYQDGRSWTDWNYYSSTDFKDIMLEALDRADIHDIVFINF